MKKSHIILSGGGDINMSFEIDEKFFSLLIKGAKILYIPVALERTMLGFEACYDWFSALVSNHGAYRDIDFTMFLEGDELPNFVEYDAIYIGGGNTYKLLSFIYRRNFNKEIVNFIEKGGVVYGGSAGAIILGKDIKTVEEENDNNYLNSEGLNLLGNKSVFCHYVESSDKKIFSIAKKINTEVLALPENSGIVFDLSGNIEEVVGKVFIFDRTSKRRV